MNTFSRRFEGRLATAVVGLIFTALVVGLSAVGVAYGFGVFSHSTTVSADLPTAGPALGPGSEVEYRGVLVGSLGKLDRELHQAVLTLDIDPDQLRHIPSNVTVRLVPRSVFGDLYVDLVPPAFVTGELRSGEVLKADTTTPTVELNQALNSGYALLTAIQPAKLAETLDAVATAFQGRGEEISHLVTQLSQYTAAVSPHTAQLIHDITVAGTLGQQVAANSADLFRVLDDSISLTSTIHADQPTLARLLNVGPLVATKTNHLLTANREKLRTLVHQLAPVIDILGHNRQNLTRTLAGLQAFTDGAAKALGQGPYLNVTAALVVDGTKAKNYTAADCPHWFGVFGPNCVNQKNKATTDAAKNSLVNAIVDKASGADKTNLKNPTALAKLKQRLSIAKLLLAPVLKSVGGLLP